MLDNVSMLFSMRFSFLFRSNVDVLRCVFSLPTFRNFLNIVQITELGAVSILGLQNTVEFVDGKCKFLVEGIFRLSYTGVGISKNF